MEIWDGYLEDETLANQDMVRVSQFPKACTILCAKHWSDILTVIICS